MSKPTVNVLNATLSKFRPQGILKFPRLVEAFDGHKFSDGKYTAQINLPKGDAEVEAFVAEINGFHKAIGGAGEVIKDGDALNRKGVRPAPDHWIMNVKAGAGSKIGYVDAQRNKIAADQFEDGDTVRVKVSAYDYSKVMSNPGISLWMQAFQLVSKVEPDFDAVEGGYVSTVVAPPSEIEVPLDQEPKVMVEGYGEIGESGAAALKAIQTRQTVQPRQTAPSAG